MCVVAENAGKCDFSLTKQNFLINTMCTTMCINAELSIRKLGSSSVLITLMKIRAYGSKALQ